MLVIENYVGLEQKRPNRSGVVTTLSVLTSNQIFSRMFTNKHERKIMSNKKKLLFLEKVADKNTSRDQIMFNIISALKKHGWKTDKKTEEFSKNYQKKSKGEK